MGGVPGPDYTYISSASTFLVAILGRVSTIEKGYLCRGKFRVHPPVLQCCGSMTFWYGSGSGFADPYHWLTDPDPVFSSVTDKMPTKNKFFPKVYCLLISEGTGTLTSVFIDKKSKRCHKILEIKVFLTSLLVMEGSDPGADKIMTDPDLGGPKTYWSYGSGSTTMPFYILHAQLIPRWVFRPVVCRVQLGK